MLCRAPVLTPEIAVLLTRAMFPDPVRVARALEAYRTEQDRTLVIWEVGGEPVCAAGLRLAVGETEVLHIGTHPEQEGRGYGRELLHAIASHLNLARLTAETDDYSVGFYRRIGFEVSDAPKRGERRRFLCVLNPQV